MTLSDPSDIDTAIVSSSDDALIVEYDISDVFYADPSEATIETVYSTDSGYLYDYQDTSDTTTYISTDPSVLINYESSYDDLSEAITA